MKEKMLDHIYELFVLADNIKDSKEQFLILKLSATYLIGRFIITLIFNI